MIEKHFSIFCLMEDIHIKLIKDDIATTQNVGTNFLLTSTKPIKGDEKATISIIQIGRLDMYYCMLSSFETLKPLVYTFVDIRSGKSVGSTLNEDLQIWSAPLIDIQDKLKLSTSINLSTGEGGDILFQMSTIYDELITIPFALYSHFKTHSKNKDLTSMSLNFRNISSNECDEIIFDLKEIKRKLYE